MPLFVKIKSWGHSLISRKRELQLASLIGSFAGCAWRALLVSPTFRRVLVTGLLGLLACLGKLFRRR
jgi:hypothetical protein